MMTVKALEAFDDNYIWLIQHDNDAWVVDPGDASVVNAYLQANTLTLRGILITHHHADHTGGINKLTAHRTVPVYGPQSTKIPSITHPLTDGATFAIGATNMSVIGVPGHTLDHIAYYTPGALFCGDTLFSAGCGRLFEGDPAMMLQSLQKLAQLPTDTLIYPAHEYTAANLRFASAVEPDNADVAQRSIDVTELRAVGRPSLPVTLAAELSYNPFLRYSEQSVISMAKQFDSNLNSNDEVAVFAAIRGWKDQFKG